MTPEQILQELRTKWDEACKKAEEVLEAFNKTMQLIAKFAGWIAEKAVQFWNDKVVPLWTKCVDWMREHWNVFGEPWTLFALASEWREQVGAPVTGRAGLATAGQLEADDNWSGRAAGAYKQRLGQQETALKSVSSQFAEAIAAACTKVAAGIITWWIAIVAAIVTLVVCLVIAAGAACTICGAPVTPPAVAIGWGAFSTALLVGTGALLTLTLMAKGDISGARNNLSSFPNGAWPTFG